MENQEQPFEVSDIVRETKQRMVDMLEQELSVKCSCRCMDSDEDRIAVAKVVVDYITRGREIDTSPEKLIPKAAYKLGFQVVDETTGERIVKILLDRTPDMTDGDFMQMQNFFWTAIGRSIRQDKELLQTLAAGGILVSTEPDDEPSGQQFAS